MDGGHDLRAGSINAQKGMETKTEIWYDAGS